MKTPEVIYNEILNNKINIEKGIQLIIHSLQESEKDGLFFDCEMIFNDLSIRFKETFNIISSLLISSQKPITTLTIAKIVVTNFSEKCEILLRDQIHRESSALFLTQLFRFLTTQITEISKILKTYLIEKYKNMYNVSFEECQFFIDLEATQINVVKELDIQAGYFKKFETDDIDILRNTSHFNYVVRDYHFLALDLSRWEFNEIPESIGFLSELQYLNLSNLELKSLPGAIEDLSNLKYLNLNGNKITKSPNWLFEFSRKQNSKKYLNEGVISSEVIELAIIEIFIGEKLQKIEQTTNILFWDTALHYKINNDGNILGIYLKNENLKLSLFPEQICELKFLEELEIPDSSIQTLPKCIGNLKSLKYFDLYNNRINFIPNTIENLINLEYLDLDDNEMSESFLLDLRWYKIGQHYLEVGEFNNAIIELNDTLKIYPKNKYGWYHLGIAHKELGNDKEAEKAFKTFLEIDSTNSLVWSELSEIYHSNKEYKKAIEAIKHAIDIEPEVAILYSNLAFNYKKLGKDDDAIKAYSHSLEIFPDNIYVWRDLASIYRDKGEIIKAIDADEHALELERKSKINLD